RPPTDQLGGPPDGLLPLAIGRGVEWDEGLALTSKVAQPELEAIDPERPGPLVDVRLDRPVDLRRTESAEGRRGCRVGEDAPGDDPRRGHPVGSAARVAAFADHAVGDVSVGA